VGFHVNWEVNNASFQIQKSTDPNFPWYIASANFNFNGCGTCGFSTFSTNDYGPFTPGVTWHYRVRAISNSNVSSFHNLGSYVCNTPTIVDWVSQVTNQFITGISPSTENSYSWFQENRDMQGVNISLSPTEISNIFLEQNNNRLRFMSSGFTPFTTLDVNVNNGGYTTIYSGSAATSFTWANSITAFSSLTQYNLKVRFTDINSNVYYREYNVFVTPKSDGLYLDNYCNSIRVWKGNDPNNGIPLVLSEGFDAYSTRPQQYYREGGKDLINCLLNKGFNIYIVNYYLNSQSIINNAAVFQSAIRYVSSINGNKKVVAMGMSMGGVVNRYACAAAEAASNPLPISKFVSIDAPQQGAVISKDMQDWRKANTTDPFEIAASDNDAAKQLLKYNAYDASGIVHTQFQMILNSINGDGYPHLVERIGIAFSNNSANPTSGTWLSVTPSAMASPILFNLSGDELQAGSYLPPIVIDPIHYYLPLLRITVTISQLQNPTFIPHNSALDIVNGVSKFNKTIMPAVTGFHDKMPASIIEEVVNVLLEDYVYVQNKTYTSSRNITARKKIISGVNVNPNSPSGQVNVNSGPSISFKAGEEIALQEGFNVLNGAEYEAIIAGVQCNNQLEFQNRTISVNTSNNGPENLVFDPLIFANDSNYIFAYSSETDLPIIKNKENVFPNPTEGNLYLHEFSGQNLSYELYSPDNKLILNGLVENKLIGLSALSKGLYFLKVSDELGNTFNFKILKN